MSTVLGIAAVILMAVALVTVPLGLPGTWIMWAVVGVGAVAGEVGWITVAALGALLLAAEGAEFLLVRALALKHGGGRGAFWGAVAGGLVGVAVGAPIPVVGSLVAGVVGTFLGAFALELWRTREARTAARVGWGAVLGRAASAAVKTGAGVVVLVVGGGALLVA